MYVSISEKLVVKLLFVKEYIEILFGHINVNNRYITAFYTTYLVNEIFNMILFTIKL